MTRTPAIFDGHNDLPWALREVAGHCCPSVEVAASRTLHTDVERLAAGGVAAQFWSVFVPNSPGGDAAVRATIEQVDVVHRLIDANPRLVFAECADDVVSARAAGLIASLIGAEGGHSINNSLPVLRVFGRLGIRYLTLTHNESIDWADSATDSPRVDGLSAFGHEVVREMNRIGMLVDLSHVADTTMRAALSTTRSPVLFSHSSARSVCDHPRNVADDILSSLSVNGGVVMVTFVPSFVSRSVRSWQLDAQEWIIDRRQQGDDRDQKVLGDEYSSLFPTPRASVVDVADHIDHVRNVAGLDHVGIGGDFDGFCEVPPVGLADVADYPNLIDELRRRSWSDADIDKLTWDNAIRLVGDVQSASRRGTPASLATIEQLDHS
jgi:membrane dipeptidase